jgi:hypothetical protein
MRRVLAAVLVAIVLVGLLAAPAQAGGAANVALGLAAFAVFNQLFWSPRVAYAYPYPVYAAPPVVYAPPTYVYAAPAYTPPPQPTVVSYPHGRYELRVDGPQYAWVWIPTPPPPPAVRAPAPPAPAAQTPPPGPTAATACKTTGKYVKTPQGFLPECE